MLIGLTNGTTTRYSISLSNNRTQIIFFGGSFQTTTWYSPLNQNQWYHLAFVESGNKITAYVNGNFISTQANQSNNNSTGLPLRFNSGSLSQFNSKAPMAMDEVRIWNVARTAAQIQNNRNCELSGNQPGLVGYYKFNNGNPGVNNAGFTTLTDASGNGRHGTLKNFSLTGTTSNWIAPGAISCSAGGFASDEISNSTSGQTGDLCETALTLTVTESPCASIGLATFASTTASIAGTPLGNTAACEGVDIWFKAIVPASGNLTFKTTSITNDSTQIAVFSGDCTTGLTQIIACQDIDNTNDGGQEEIILTGRTPGETLFLRVDDQGQGGEIGACAYSVTPPENDHCSGAISLILGNKDANAFTFAGATASVADIPLGNTIACEREDGEQGIGVDVWFKAVVPESGLLSFMTTTLTNEDTEVSVFTGNCTTGLTEILSCSNEDGGNNNGQELVEMEEQMPGDILYFRVGDLGYRGEIGAFAFDPLSVPNDDCLGAITIPVSDACSPIGYTFEEATQSVAGAPPGNTAACSDSEEDGVDIWFKVIVPASGQLTFLTSTVTNYDVQVAVFSGGCAGGLTEIIACQDADNTKEDGQEQIDLSGRTPGETLFFRVDDAGDKGEVGICVFTDPVAAAAALTPTNDICSGATLLTISTVCKPDIYTFDGATESEAGTPIGNTDFCDGTDIWFKAVVPASGKLTFLTTLITNTDTKIAVFSGDCSGGLMEIIACQDEDGVADGHEVVELRGRTPGETIFFRVDDSGFGGKIGVCLTSLNTDCVVFPTAPAVADLTYCQEEKALVLSTSGSNLLWYNTNGGVGSTAAPVPNTSTAGIQEFFVSQTENSCESVRSKIVVTVEAASVGGAITGAAPEEVCLGANTTELVLNGSIGVVQKWQYDTDANFSNPIDVANTTGINVVEDLVEKTYYRAIVKNGLCPEDYSPLTAIPVDLADFDMDGIGDDCDCDGFAEDEMVVGIFGGQITTGTYKAGREIRSAGSVNSGNTVNFKAGQSIVLEPGFQAKAGSAFHAFIEPCVVDNTIIAADTIVEQYKVVVPTSISTLPLSFKVSPNPFVHQTKLQFRLPKEEVVSIQVFDQSGRLLEQVLSPQTRPAGDYEVFLTTENLYDGLFFVILQTPQERIIKKVIAIKSRNFRQNDD